MTHQEIVKRARTLGLSQCQGSTFRTKTGKDQSKFNQHTQQVCEIGLLHLAQKKGWITEMQQWEIQAKIRSLSQSSITRLNDLCAWTFDDFTQLIDKNIVKQHRVR